MVIPAPTSRPRALEASTAAAKSKPFGRQSAASLGLTGQEVYDVENVDGDLNPGQELTLRATDATGDVKTFTTIVHIDSPVEVDYYHNGGVLHTVLRNMAIA